MSKSYSRWGFRVVSGLKQFHLQRSRSRETKTSLGLTSKNTAGTVDPAPVEVGSFPIIYRVFLISGGAGFLPSTGLSENIRESSHFHVFLVEKKEYERLGGACLT